MFVALDTARDVAVGVDDIPKYDANHAMCPDSETGEYRCLRCGSELQYQNRSGLLRHGRFAHTERSDDCFNDGNVSVTHRRAQEIVLKQLVNWLPSSQQLPQVDIERRIGSNSDFVITDVSVLEPVRLAVEVIHQNRHLCLSRRLSTLFKRGYAVMFVVISKGAASVDQVQDQVNSDVPPEIGTFDAQTHSLTLGSPITPDTTDISRSAPEFV